MKRLILLGPVTVATLFAGAPPDKPTAPKLAVAELAVADVAAAFKSYRRMTDKEVFVNPELAMLCIGASQAQVEAARATKGPHAHSAIVVYMNEIAAKDFGRGDGVYAPGAVVVKQKTLLGFRGEKSGARMRGTDHGVGGMIKRAKGYDPAHGDWEYFYFEDAAQIEKGRIASCIKCHDTAKGTGYVFGSWVPPASKKFEFGKAPEPGTSTSTQHRRPE